MPTSGCKSQVSTIQKGTWPCASGQQKLTFGELAGKWARAVSTDSTGKKSFSLANAPLLFCTCPQWAAAVMCWGSQVCRLRVCQHRPGCSPKRLHSHQFQSSSKPGLTLTLPLHCSEKTTPAVMPGKGVSRTQSGVGEDLQGKCY